MDKLFELSRPLLVKLPIVFTTKGAIVATFLSIFFAKTCQVQMLYILGNGYNNVNPRVGKEDGTWQSRAIARARSAQDNSWEAFIGFSAAMLLALTTPGVNQEELHMCANAFVFVRVAYIIAYVLAYNAPLSGIRSSIWLVGLGITLHIFSMAIGPVWA